MCNYMQKELNLYAVIYMYSIVLTWFTLPVVFIVMRFSKPCYQTQAGFGFAFTQLSRLNLMFFVS